MTCTRSKTSFKNEKGAWKTACKHYISYMKDTVKRTPGQRAFRLHMLFGVVLLASISKYCMQRLRTVRTCKFLWDLGVLYSIKGHSKCCYCSVVLVIIELWSIGDPLLRSWSLSWRIGESRNLVKRNGFSRIKILRRVKPPWFAFFLPNAKIWAYFNHFRVRSIKRVLE